MYLHISFHFQDTSTSAPKPRTRISTPNATLPETSNIPDTTSATNIVPNGPCETKYNTDSSGPRKKCRDGSPNRIKGPSASGESAEKTQKWFWRTLKQETLLQSKASKTIRIRVTHIPAIGEFYCQTLGVFPGNYFIITYLCLAKKRNAIFEVNITAVQVITLQLGVC